MADVVIIEDSQYQRGVLKWMLNKHGYSVHEAADGKIGLELVATVRPDCITIDIAMPVMDGLGGLKALQEIGDDTPKIIMSADIQKSTHDICIGLGADVVLTKPPREDELIQTIKRLVSERSLATP